MNYTVEILSKLIHYNSKIQVVELKVGQDIHDPVDTALKTLQSEGKVRILSMSGHKGFVFGYKVNILISNITSFNASIRTDFPFIYQSYLVDVRFVAVSTLIKENGGRPPIEEDQNDEEDKADIIASNFIKVHLPNLNEYIPPTEPLTPPHSKQSDEMFGFHSYHTIHSIYNHLEELSRRHSDVLELFELDGVTYEGRKLRGVRITNGVRTSVSHDKPLVYLDGGIHSREWISPATVMYLIEGLIGRREQDKSTQTAALRETFQFVLIPVTNPDGYIYSREERMWRKTRKPAGCQYNLRDCNGDCLLKVCYGVDANRNWDVDYAAKGGSNEPCDTSFPGSAPFDQDCVVIIRDFLLNHKEKIVLSISYHSYSQLFLYPWGYTKSPSPHRIHHTKVGEAFTRAVEARHGVHYKNHPVVNIWHDRFPASWYEVSGTLTDWVHHHLGVVDSYGIELRDEGQHDFRLPVNQILPTGEENFDGLLAVVDNIAYYGAP